VPEELEQQWQNVLSSKSALRHRIVLKQTPIQSLKNHGLWTEHVVPDFPLPVEIESGRLQLDCVVTTFGALQIRGSLLPPTGLGVCGRAKPCDAERMGSRKGKRDGRSQQDKMQSMQDGLARVHWQRIIIDEGHELGGRNLGDLVAVYGAVLASTTVRALPRRLGGLSVFHSKYVLCGVLVWVHMALNSRKRWLPAPPGSGSCRAHPTATYTSRRTTWGRSPRSSHLGSDPLNFLSLTFLLLFRTVSDEHAGVESRRCSAQTR
jgi:hypothetical protein